MTLAMTMGSEDDWNATDKVVIYLAKQLNRGRLALCLGAGIMVPFGFPCWEDLLDRIFEDAGETPSAETDLLRKADILRNRLYRDNYSGYLAAVHAALYSDVNVDLRALRSRSTVSAVGALAMASLRGNASTIVTLNYDDILEYYLRCHGFVVNSVYSPVHWSQRCDVSIYHPHGFLSRDRVTRSEKILLDQQSYSEEANASPWQALLSHTFSSHTVLFVGLSGRDSHLDALMTGCMQEHASKQHGTAYWGTALSTPLSDDDKVKWESRGVKVLEVADYDEALPELLFKICETAATFAAQR